MRRCIGIVLSFVSLSACASAPAPSRPTLEEPLLEETAAPVAKPVRIANPSAPCPLQYHPKDIGHVLVIPGVLMARAMKPAMAAVCACTGDGDEVAIVALIDFGAGTVKTSAPGDEAINGCLAGMPATFEPVPESELPSSDCIDCGPRRYGVFPGNEPEETKPKGGLKVSYPFRVDRREAGKAEPQP